jgi:hypothetical protein
VDELYLNYCSDILIKFIQRYIKPSIGELVSIKINSSLNHSNMNKIFFPALIRIIFESDEWILISLCAINWIFSSKKLID